MLIHRYCFNTQPPEGGWAKAERQAEVAKAVSTHSRPKAAGTVGNIVYIGF